MGNSADNKRKKILYIGKNEKRSARMPDKGPFVEALRELGELTILRNGDQLSETKIAELIRECNILLTMWGSTPVPGDIAENRGNLEYICNITGGIRHWIPLNIIEVGIPVTNWGDAPAQPIAESAVTLLLACLKDLHKQIQHMRNGGWRLEAGDHQRGSLKGLHVGLYGFGVIGRKFAELIRPFGPIQFVYDPYVSDLPAYCTRVDSLDELFSVSQAVAIHVGLSLETEKSVTAELLARLPDHGIVINTARGKIIDEDALYAELLRGRLRAGLDVLATDDDPLDPEHPWRELENCILTAHSLGKNKWNEPLVTRYQEICLENLKRFLHGKPLKFIMDRDRYMRST